MRGFSRRDVRAQALGPVTLASLFALACAGGSPSSGMLAPSPIITPDAATIKVGAAQIFSVQNAAVARFEVFGDHENSSNCVLVDTTLAEANSIRVVGRKACQGLVFVRARIGDQRSPLVAVLKVE